MSGYDLPSVYIAGEGEEVEQELEDEEEEQEEYWGELARIDHVT